MTRETYRSPRYAANRVVTRYVRAALPGYGGFKVFEVGADNFTLREYLTEGAEIPEAIRALAITRYGEAFGQVEWRMDP